MFRPNLNQQHSPSTGAPSVQSSSPLVAASHGEASGDLNHDAQNGGLPQADSIVQFSKMLQDELQSLGSQIKQLEASILSLKAEKNKLDDSILDKQVALGKYHSTRTTKRENEDHNLSDGGEETAKQILHFEMSAASILCQLNYCHKTQASHHTLTKDILGIVATLGKVDDDNLSWLFSEYLGLETMMAIVLRTYEGLKTLESYDKQGFIDNSSGIYELGASIGKIVEGRYLVICLESLRPYEGDFVDDDPQRRLDLLEPRLPNGERPPGFLGFAVNMINVESKNLLFVMPTGYGLRETLFYNLFARVQVYRTRTEMLQALPCISDGALSLDGGIIRTKGVFSLGDRVDVNARFSKSCGASSLPGEYLETENQIKEMKSQREKILGDLQRERQLLDRANANFQKKKKEFVEFLAASSSYIDQQQQFPTAQG